MVSSKAALGVFLVFILAFSLSIAFANTEAPHFPYLFSEYVLNENTTLSIEDIFAEDSDSPVENITLIANGPSFMSFIDKSNGTGNFTFTPGFTSSGNYTVILIASDESLINSTEFNVSILNVNRVPEILLGDSEVLVGSLVIFNASASDYDGDSLNYTWLQISGPNINSTTFNNHSLNPFFTPKPIIGDSSTEYVFRLTVNDGLDTVSSILTITALAPPVIVWDDLLYDKYPKNYSIYFSAENTYDMNNDTELIYYWYFGDGETSTTNVPRVYHTYKNIGTYLFTLNVSDGELTGTKKLNVTIDLGPPRPNIVQPVEDKFKVGEDIVFLPSGIDIDGSIVKYIWDFGDITEPWGYLERSGNLLSCASRTTSDSCKGSQNYIYNLDKGLVIGSECACLVNSTYIYSNSVVETFGAEPVIFSYSKATACDDSDNPTSRKCTVTLIAKDDSGLSGFTTKTITLEQQAVFYSNQSSQNNQSSQLPLCGQGEIYDELFNGCVSVGSYLISQEQDVPPPDPFDLVNPDNSGLSAPPIPPELGTPQESVQTSRANVEIETPAVSGEKTKSSNILLVAVVLLIAIISIFYYLYKRGSLDFILSKLSGEGASEKSNLGELSERFSPITGGTHRSTSSSDNYIKDMRAQGYSYTQIKSALLKKGWTEEQINHAFSNLD